jgi:protein-S-isoprenylcysteine O-methyltransferase Ste14
MRIWGVGPRLFLFSFLYSIIPIFLTSRYPEYFIVYFVPISFFKTVGIALLAVGIPFYAFSARTLLKGFKQGILCTDGVYSIVRHPLYCALIVFIIPGVLMFFRSWALFTIPIAAYFIFKILIREEEQCLAERFGEEYLIYKSKVRAILPFPRF